MACLRNGIPWPHKRLLAPASNGFYARLEHFERLFMSLCASRLSRFFPHYLLMTCKCISASSHHCPFTIYVCDSISLITLELSTKKIAISCARLCHCFRYSFQMALKTFRSILSSFFPFIVSHSTNAVYIAVNDVAAEAIASSRVNNK